MNLTAYVNQVSLEDFGKPFEHQAVWNKRLKTTGGRFFPADLHLDFNPVYLEKCGLAVFRQIVRHELCHYHLYREQKGYRHRDRDFQELLAAVDGLRYTPRRPQEAAKWHYQCDACGQSYPRKRRMNHLLYRCSRCGGRISPSKSV